MGGTFYGHGVETQAVVEWRHVKCSRERPLVVIPARKSTIIIYSTEITDPRDGELSSPLFNSM
jgi:hypothetical protein